LLLKITAIEDKGIESPGDLNVIRTVTQGCPAGVRYIRAGSKALGMAYI
jgi:hypothetical protein